MKSIQTLDNLRDIKATAERSSVGFQTPQIQDGCLQKLKQLTLMHIPSSVTEETRLKLNKTSFWKLSKVTFYTTITLCI
jgi:hypothetical protein